MMVHITCTYCGHEWIKNLYMMSSSKDIRCNVCNDPQVKVQELDKVDKIDYYQGSPPFPEKKKEEKPAPTPFIDLDYDTYL